jgi:signal transduction histidine kinase
VAREAIERFDPAHRICSLSAAKPIVGFWDRVRLDQVASNLIQNAIKYGEGKPVEVTVTEAEMGRASLCVTDHGQGIAPDAQSRIFERFQRAVPKPQHQEGLGLGLYIAQSIVTAHGGTIGLVSAVGAGSTFTVELPRL